MRDIKAILEDYRQGDFEKRLYLYLLYRDFRREFGDIEKNGEASKRTKRKFLSPFYLTRR